MDIMQAKLAVIEAGKKLVEKGLIARTWGNVSCRISSDEFVITPSGRSYEDLTPDEIVTVKISDLSYEGDVKPSSEKGVHASAYMLRPECNFVIHTHQLNASVVSVMGKDMPLFDGAAGTARQTRRLLEARGLLKNGGGHGTVTLTASDPRALALYRRLLTS
jgi:L-ribulose-5-phosphate 4-epimerase